MGPCTVRKAQQSERHNSPKGTTVRANSPKGTTVSSDCPRSVEAQFEHCSQAAQYCCNNDVPAIDKLLHPAIRGVLYSDVETLASASHTPGGRRCQRLHVLWVLVAMPAESVWSRSKADITVTGDDLSLETAKGDNLTRGVPAQLRGVCPRSKVTYRERSVGEHFRTLPPHRRTSTHRTRSGCKARRNIAS